MNDFDDIQALWRDQPTHVPEVDMTEIATKANRFHKLVALRNVSEWLATVFVITVFIAVALTGDYPIVSRVGAILIAIGAALVAHRLVLDGRLRELPDATQDTQTYIATYRTNLEQQASLLEKVWTWYLGPFVPGLVTFLVGLVIAEPAYWTRILPIALLCLAVFLAIGWLNRRAAKKLRDRAEKLPPDP